MEINPLTALATIINFIILILVLRHFFFKKVSDLISSRENEINTRITNAEKDEEKARLLRIENEEKLKGAVDEGKAIVEDFKARAGKLSEEIVAKAKEEAEFLLEKAKNDAEREREKAEDEIKLQAINLAILLSSKALEASIDEKEHRRLIKDFITKVGI